MGLCFDRPIQRCFRLKALLSVQALSEGERGAVVASLRQEERGLERARMAQGCRAPPTAAAKRKRGDAA